MKWVGSWLRYINEKWVAAGSEFEYIIRMSPVMYSGFSLQLFFNINQSYTKRRHQLMLLLHATTIFMSLYVKLQLLIEKEEL